MGDRKAWKDLSPAYRARLERHGVTARTHGVANLTEARGHPSRPPAGAAPKELVERLVRGEAEPQDFKKIKTQFTRPAWVPKSAPIDVQAALSRLPDPKRWESVEFVPRDDGQPWTMIVKMKGNAYDKEILIPGGGGPGTGARAVLEIVTELGRNSEEAERRRRRKTESLFFDVMGSDEEAA
jgi:hypothetical protein